LNFLGAMGPIHHDLATPMAISLNPPALTHRARPFLPAIHQWHQFPPEIMKASTHVWCRAKVVRIEQQLSDGKFGVALAFTSVQQLPEAYNF
jgi:hypothetical protein